MATITGTFPHIADAESAVTELTAKGWTQEAISVLTTPKKTEPQEAEPRPHTHLAIKDAEKGAFIGSLSGLLLGLSEFAVPGVGPILIGGWIAAALLGTGVGAVAGGLAGILAEAGISLEEGHHLAERVHSGETLVIVSTTTTTQQLAHDILSRHHAIHIQESGDPSGTGVLI